jgi:hypothetical protein
VARCTACGWLAAPAWALTVSAATAVEPDGAAEPAPSAELLLYLAEFADADGEPIDPAEVARALERGPAPNEPGAAPRTPARPPPRQPDADDDVAPERHD